MFRATGQMGLSGFEILILMARPQGEVTVLRERRNDKKVIIIIIIINRAVFLL